MTQHVLINHTRIALKAMYLELPPVSDVPIIFLHDSLGCITVWKDFPLRLAEKAKRSAVVYDRQGYGQSGPFSKPGRDNYYMEAEADFLVRFMNRLNIEKAILFGHSDGGSIALIATGKYPDRVEAIITEGAHVFVEEITLAGIREAAELYQTTDLRSKLEKHHGDKTDALFQAWTETWQTPTFWQWNVESFLPKINCPVLVIQGENDEYGSLSQVEAVYSKVSGIKEKLIIPGAGHTPHKEQGDLVVEAVANFLKVL